MTTTSSTSSTSKVRQLLTREAWVWSNTARDLAYALTPKSRRTR